MIWSTSLQLLVTRTQILTLAETRGMLGKQTGHRAANFTKNMKSNSRGDKNTSIKDLCQDLRRKRYNDNK